MRMIDHAVLMEKLEKMLRALTMEHVTGRSTRKDTGSFFRALPMMNKY